MGKDPFGEGKETSQKQPRAKAGFAKPTTIKSELPTKQSDSCLDVSGEAKADAIMEEDRGEEEDGQGEEEEENDEKSQSHVARDSSTVNS